MKILKKALCVILSVLMAMSCLSAVAFAAETQEKAQFTDSLKYYVDKEESYGIGKLLDAADVILKNYNIKKEVDLGIVKLTVDLTSIGAICKTIDDYKGVLQLATFIGAGLLGDLKDIELGTWQTGLKRGSGDVTILKELLELANANKNLVEKICNNTINLGIFNSFIDLEEYLGKDGVSGKIKEMLIGFLTDADPKKVYETYKNDMDAFVFDTIDGLAEEYLPGFTMDENSTVEDLLCLLFDLVFEQYIAPNLKKINFDLSQNENEEIRLFASLINLDGSTYDFDGVNFESDKSFLSQVNNIVGEIFTQIVPGYRWIEGDYTKISENIEKACKYLGKESGLIPKADTMSFEEIVKEIIAVILKNIDLGVYDDGVTECETIEDMLKVVLVNASKKIGVGVTYKDSDSYLVVLGDIVAFYAYNFMDFRDLNGNVCMPGDGKDVFEVVNYIVNYLLADMGIAGVIGLSCKKADSIFVKIDKLLDYFGKTKAQGVSFNSEEFLLGSAKKKGLLDSIFTLDIQNIIEITAVPALRTAGDVSVVEFIYRSVQYWFNNWAGATMVPEYQTKAFTNALHNKNIGNMVSVLLSVLNTRSAKLTTLLSKVMSVLSSYKVTSTIYAVIDFIKNDSSDALDKIKNEIGALGGLFDVIKGFLEDNKDKLDVILPYIDAIAENSQNTYDITELKIEDVCYTGSQVSPKATVKLGSKALTQGKDYIVITDSIGVGSATATVKGIGYYDGAFEVPFNIVLGKVETVTVARSESILSLTWDAVYGADSYNVYMLEKGKYVLKQASASTNYRIEGLSSATNYSFKIEAVSSEFGLGEAVTLEAVTRPDKVKKSTVKATIADTSAVFTWTDIKGASGYRIDAYLNGAWKKIKTVTDNTVKISGLKGSTKYTFRIYSYVIDDSGNVIYSMSPESFYITTKVSTVAGLSATSNSSAIKLTWNKASDATGYEVWYLKNGKTWTKYKTVTGTSLTISNLTANKEYNFRVRAYRKTASGNVTGSAKQIDVYTKLKKTTGLKLSKATTSGVKLTWSKVSGAEGYEVYYYKNGAWSKIKNTSTNSVSISGMKSGTTYKFLVRAYRKAGSGYVYGENSASFSAQTLLAQVTNLKASARKASSITLKWDKVTGATGYEVYRYNGSKWVKIATVKTNSYTNTGLSRNTQYNYRVRAYGTVNGATSYGSATSTLKVKTTII